MRSNTKCHLPKISHSFLPPECTHACLAVNCGDLRLGSGQIIKNKLLLYPEREGRAKVSTRFLLTKNPSCSHSCTFQGGGGATIFVFIMTALFDDFSYPSSENHITPPAQSGVEGSVILLLTKNPACSFSRPLPGTRYLV